MTPTTALEPYDFEVAEIREAGLALATQAEARRVELKAPALAECQAIDTAFGDATAPFKTAKALIGTKAGVYFAAKKAKEEAARRETERIEREALAARAKAEAEAAAAQKRGEEPAPAPEPVEVAPATPIPVAQAVTRTEAGTVGMVRVRGYKVVDESQIPREYWILDGARIAKEYKTGGDVPGCEEDIAYIPRTH